MQMGRSLIRSNYYLAEHPKKCALSGSLVRLPMSSATGRRWPWIVRKCLRQMELLVDMTSLVSPFVHVLHWMQMCQLAAMALPCKRVGASLVRLLHWVQTCLFVATELRHQGVQRSTLFEMLVQNQAAR